MYVPPLIGVVGRKHHYSDEPMLRVCSRRYGDVNGSAPNNDVSGSGGNISHHCGLSLMVAASFDGGKEEGPRAEYNDERCVSGRSASSVTECEGRGPRFLCQWDIEEAFLSGITCQDCETIPSNRRNSVIHESISS